jgi:hypothetical protein
VVPDGAAIDWDRCRDLFLVLLLQRLEQRSNSPHPAIVRGLLERRLAGEDVSTELSAAAWAATWAAAGWGVAWADTAAATAATATATATAATAAADAAWATAAAAADERAVAAERADQLADLQAAARAATGSRCGAMVEDSTGGGNAAILNE